jgi:hypothetical protein
MSCPSCRSTVPDDARFCHSCGWSIKGRLAPGVPDPSMEALDIRERLLDCYLNFSISKELSEWLQELGHLPTGTIEDKIALIRQHANSLVLPAESFLRQTIFYLSQYDADILSEICLELGISAEGSQEKLFRRIYREIGRREGWLQPIPEDVRLMIQQTFLPILKGFDFEKDYFLDLMDQMSDLLGEENVHLNISPAHGSAFIVVLIPDLLQEAHAALFRDELKTSL